MTERRKASAALTSKTKPFSSWNNNNPIQTVRVNLQMQNAEYCSSKTHTQTGCGRVIKRELWIQQGVWTHSCLLHTSLLTHPVRPFSDGPMKIQIAIIEHSVSFSCVIHLQHCKMVCRLLYSKREKKRITIKLHSVSKFRCEFQKGFHCFLSC